MTEHSRDQETEQTTASSYLTAAGEFFTPNQWVTMAYGVRARAADLQALHRDRVGGVNRAAVADAQRAISDLDNALLRHVAQSTEAGEEIFQHIKSTQLGSLKHLSQRLREVLTTEGAAR